MHGHLSPDELSELRRALVRERDTLSAALRARTAESRGVAGDEIEDGDVAERMVVQDDALQQRNFDAALLADVEHALEKLDAGKYGTSEDSGAPIPLARLRALPWARRTLEEEERRG